MVIAILIPIALAISVPVSVAVGMAVSKTISIAIGTRQSVLDRSLGEGEAAQLVPWDDHARMIQYAMCIGSAITKTTKSISI